MARKKANIHYLYKTTCLVTGRWYIGMHSTCNIDDGYMGSGRRLRASLRKYGVDNHNKEILEFFETRELLIEAEIKAITEDMVLDNNCMNLMCGGTGGFVSLEACKKGGVLAQQILRDKLKDSEYRKITMKKLSDSMKLAFINGVKKRKINYDWNGKTHSDDAKQKMSETKKGTGVGETNSQYGTCWITKDGLNKKIKKEEIDTYLNEGWVKGRK